MNILFNMKIPVHQKCQRDKHERQEQLIVMVIDMTGKTVGDHGINHTQRQIQHEPLAVVTAVTTEEYLIVSAVDQPYKT